MPWRQLAIKAIVSGILVAVASEAARRNPGWGGLIASLPLTTLIAATWLWQDTADPTRTADFITNTAWYVIAALPAFWIIAALLRHGIPFGPAMFAGALAAFAGYGLLM